MGAVTGALAIDPGDGRPERLDAFERAASLALQTLGDTAQYRAIARHLVARVLEEWPRAEEPDAAPA